MFVVIRAHLRHCACPTNAHIHFSMLRFVSLRHTTTSATLLTTNPSAQSQGVSSKGASAALCLSDKCSHTLQYAALCQPATHYHICNPSDDKLLCSTSGSLI